MPTQPEYASEILRLIILSLPDKKILLLITLKENI